MSPQTIFTEKMVRKMRIIPAHRAPPDSNQPVEVSHKVKAEVKEELAKKNLKESMEQEARLANLAKRSQKVLFKCQNIFPFDFFPDEISVEPTQINIRKRDFFFTDHLLTIPVDNISDIHVQTSPFFASMTFIDRSFVENSIDIRFMKISDAKYVRELVQGLIIAAKENVDVGKIRPEILKQQVEQLGSMQGIS